MTALLLLLACAGHDDHDDHHDHDDHAPAAAADRIRQVSLTPRPSQPPGSWSRPPRWAS